MNLLHFDSEQSWLAGVVSLWRDRLRMDPSLRHCLASGNTPIPVYRELACAARRGEVSFARSAVFALDEFGGLARDDAGRCSNMLQRDLLNNIDLPKPACHFLDPDAADLNAECRAYENAIGTGFDLVILGIGTNGHLGMNEPGSAADSLTRRVDLHESTISSSARYLTHQRLPRWGLTVGMKQFFASREVWLLATGPNKAEIVRRTARGEVTEQVPASLMRQHPRCSLWVDAAAGALL
jgi:glucosamine-6-phosphate deaminase